MSRLKEMYKNEIMDAMTKKFGYKHVMEVPKLDKIVINMVTKHNKPSAANQAGGITTKEAALHISNVMLVVDGKATRVGFQMDGDKKVRVAKATGKVID